MHYPDAKVYDKQATGPEAICKPPSLLVRSVALFALDILCDCFNLYHRLILIGLLRVPRGRASKIGSIDFMLIRLGCVLQRLTMWSCCLQVIDILHPGRPNVPKVSHVFGFLHMFLPFYCIFADLHFLDGMSHSA